MIINTGGRTDTVQYYSEWLLNRFKEGFVYSRNPFYPNKVTRYELAPDKVDCVVFCSKNYEPILDRLHEITDRFNTYFHYTITAYETDIEPRVPSIDKSIETLLKLGKIVGKQRIAWRYDPVLLTGKYTVDYHMQTFDNMANRLSEHIDRCIFSFVEMYKKLSVNMPELKPITEGDETVGNTTKAKCVKNKVAKPFAKVEVPMVFGKGFDVDMDNQMFIINSGIVERINNVKWAYTTNDGTVIEIKGKDNIIPTLKTKGLFDEAFDNAKKKVFAHTDNKSEYTGIDLDEEKNKTIITDDDLDG